MDKPTKIILYLTDDKRVYLKYTNDADLKDRKKPEKYIETGQLMNLNEILERWQLDKNKFKKSKNELTLVFKLLIRKT